MRLAPRREWQLSNRLALPEAMKKKLIASVWISCFGLLFYLVLAKLERPVSISRVLIPCALLLTLHTSCVYVLHDTLGLCASCGALLGYLSFRRTAWSERSSSRRAKPVCTRSWSATAVTVPG